MSDSNVIRQNLNTTDVVLSGSVSVPTGTTGRFSLPAGIQFDLTKIKADGQTSYNTPLIGSAIGSFYGCDTAGLISAYGVVYAFDANYFGAEMPNGTMGTGVKFCSLMDFGNSHLGANANNGFTMQLTAPIL